MTLTGNVTDILRAINLNNTQKSLKSNTHKLAKTIKEQEQAMTEDDLDKLFNNAAKSKVTKHDNKTTIAKNSKNCTKKKVNEAAKNKENIKKNSKLKT